MGDKQKENIIDFKLLSRVLKFVQPYKTVFFVSIFFSISLGLLSVARPIIIEYTVDNFIIGKNPEMLLRYTLIMIGLLFLESIFQFLFVYVANWIGQSVIKDIREHLTVGSRCPTISHSVHWDPISRGFGNQLICNAG